MASTEHILYALSNESIPGLIKIGVTDNLEQRLSQLYNTSTPAPFVVVDTLSFKSRDEVTSAEKAFHEYLWMFRDNDNREFFAITPNAVKLMFKKYRENSMPATPEITKKLGIYKSIDKDIKEANKNVQDSNSKLIALNKDIASARRILSLVKARVELEISEYNHYSQENAYRYSKQSQETQTLLNLQSANIKQMGWVKEYRENKRSLEKEIKVLNNDVRRLKKQHSDLVYKTCTLLKIEHPNSSSSTVNYSKVIEQVNNLKFLLDAYSVFNPVRYIKVKLYLKRALHAKEV